MRQKISDSRAVYEKRLVAYMDLLGFKTKIEDSKKDTALRRELKTLLGMIHDTNDFEFGDMNRIVSTFSDSIVISYPGNKESAFFHLLLDVIHTQLNAGGFGYMIRGGIAFGDCYHDSKIVFGPALNEAYRLESEKAIWPRVILTGDTIIQAINNTIEKNPYSIKYDLEEIVSFLKEDCYEDELLSNTVDGDNIDSDKVFFVDYLTQSQELIDFGDEYLEWLRKMRVSIISGLNRYCPSNPNNTFESSETQSIFSKYRWILNYWNDVVGDDNRYMPVPDIEPIYQELFREEYGKLKIRKKYPYV